MERSEELDRREGLVYDPGVKRYDSSFWQGDTANLLADTVKNAIKIGDTGLVGSASSFSQYLYGDFEFTVRTDCLSPDSNDSEKYWGLRNLGDTLNRGAAFFAMNYDTTAGDSSPNARSFMAIAFDEWGTRVRRIITWDSAWDNSANTRYRISWESDGYKFLVNDTVYANIQQGVDTNDTEFLGNQSIPQALRLSNRSLDTTDTSVTTLKLLNIRHARKVI